MNRLFLIITLLFSLFNLNAQQDVLSIPIKTKWAADFHFANDSNKMSCLYLDLKDVYQFVVIDSNYNAIKHLSGRFNSSIKPKLAGVTAANGVFDFYFKKVEDDVLILLSVDANKGKIYRNNKFEISTNKTEKVLISGWMGWENSMMSVSKSGNRILFKNFLPGKEIKERFFEAVGSDTEFLENAECVQAIAEKDSLWLMFKKNSVKYKSPKHRLFLVDLISGNYRTVDFNCELDKSREYYSVRVRDDIVISRECTEFSRIYKKSTGEFLTEIQLNGMMIRDNENIPILKYNYTHPYDIPLGAKLVRNGKYNYLNAGERKELGAYAEPRITIIEFDSVKFYKLTFKPYMNDQYQPSYRAFVAINPKDYSPDFEQDIPAEKLNKLLIYYIGLAMRSLGF